MSNHNSGGLSVKQYEVIFKKHWKDVYKVCHFHTRDENFAADLTQNVFVMLWHKRFFLLDEGMIKHYLLRSAKLEALNFNRQTRSHKQKTELLFAASERSSGEQTTEQDVLNREAQRRLAQYISDLPAKSRSILKMSIYDGFSNSAIASEMEMGEKNVEYHLYKAIKFIRSKIL